MLLELTSVHGLPVFVNPYMVESIQQLHGETLLGLASGDHLLVKEDAAEVNLELESLVASHQQPEDMGQMH